MSEPERPKDAVLEKLLGYTFLDKSLLTTALTHPSLGDGHRSTDQESNARLEFLGDAVLGLVAAEMAFDRKPHLDEDGLTKERGAFVKNAHVQDLAVRLKLGPWLYLGGAELKSQGRGERKRLGDALEAIIGAIHRDAGPVHAASVVRRLLRRYPMLRPTAPK